MLGQSSVFATIAVKDIAVGKAFYGDKLGLELVQEDPSGLLFQSGDSKVFVYPSTYAGTNQATYAGWVMDDVDACVAELKEKGIVFEHYDMPETTWEGDVAIMGSMRGAWFKDPDGNILSVSNPQ